MSRTHCHGAAQAGRRHRAAPKRPRAGQLGTIIRRSLACGWTLARPGGRRCYQLSGAADRNAGIVEKLLADIREIVEAPRHHAVDQWRAWVAAGRAGLRPPRLTRAQRPAKIRTADLMLRLFCMAHRPWQEANRAKPITERWLSNRLRGLDVNPALDRGARVGFRRARRADPENRLLRAWQAGPPATAEAHLHDLRFARRLETMPLKVLKRRPSGLM